jgi:ribosomal protein S18 acetylase RimI-like enzyme
LPYDVIDVRQFDSNQLAHLLDAEAQAWNLALRWDYASSRRVIANCLDEKRLAGYALCVNGDPKGYSYFFYEGDKALIGNLFVETAAPDRIQRAGLLLRHVLETLLATPRLARVETQLPHFTLEELEPFFRVHGFQAHLRRFMILSLARRKRIAYSLGVKKSADVVRPVVVPPDFQLLPWERRHDRAAAEMVASTYRHHIDAQINDQYASRAGSARLLESIVQQHGCGELIPGASLVAIHQPTGRLAAALAVTTVRARTAHIPQIAAAPEFQGHGLGSALLEMALQELCRRDYEEVSLTVTDLNAGAVRLYQRLEFETFRTFGAFTWQRR